jgi:hypothetical protein
VPLSFADGIRNPEDRGRVRRSDSSNPLRPAIHLAVNLLSPFSAHAEAPCNAACPLRAADFADSQNARKGVSEALYLTTS